jgi:hypothetical protein
MRSAAEILSQLIEADQELADLLSTYAELEGVYLATLSASDKIQRTEASVKNTAEVRVTFSPTPSSAGWTG